MLFALRCIRTYIFPRQNMFKFGGFSSRLRSPTHTHHIYIYMHIHRQHFPQINIYIYFNVWHTDATHLLIYAFAGAISVDLCYLLFKDFKRNMMDMDVRWIWINALFLSLSLIRYSIWSLNQMQMCLNGLGECNIYAKCV